MEEFGVLVDPISSVNECEQDGSLSTICYFVLLFRVRLEEDSVGDILMDPVRAARSSKPECV